MTAKLITCSLADYQADNVASVPSLSASIAKKLIDQSPMHAWLAHARLNPSYAREEDGDFDIGNAAHEMVLERTQNKIVWCDFKDWRTNDSKDMRAAARTAGKLPILIKYQQPLADMVAAAHACIHGSELAGILDTGTAEQPIMWMEGETACRSRLDILGEDKRVILDYKSTFNAQPDAFIRQIGRMSYDLQAEFYTRGVRAVTEQEPRFVFLAQETTPPYACSLIALSNTYREIGQIKFRRALRIWAECMASGKWPGYTSSICYAEPPTWAILEWADEEEAQEA